MRGTSRTGVAALLVLALLFTGSFVLRPAIPSRHGGSWQWMAPWRVQQAEASYDQYDPMIWAMELVILGVLANATLEGLQQLAAEQLYDYLRNLWESGGGGDTSSGGGEPARLEP